TAGEQELDALITAAKAEGEVVYYFSPPENIGKRIGDSFTAKYGIKYSFVRTVGAGTITRFGNEALSGTFAADLIVTASRDLIDAFVPEAFQKGWIEKLSEASIPALRSGQFPEKFLRPYTAVVQVLPWGIAYSKDRLGGGEPPRDWPDVL